MCGRYELHAHPAALALAFGVAHPPEIPPRYDIARTQRIPIIRAALDRVRELSQLRYPSDEMKACPSPMCVGLRPRSHRPGD